MGARFCWRRIAAPMARVDCGVDIKALSREANTGEQWTACPRAAPVQAGGPAGQHRTCRTCAGDSAEQRGDQEGGSSCLHRSRITGGSLRVAGKIGRDAQVRRPAASGGQAWAWHEVGCCPSRRRPSTLSTQAARCAVPTLLVEIQSISGELGSGDRHPPRSATPAESFSSLHPARHLPCVSCERFASRRTLVVWRAPQFKS